MTIHELTKKIEDKHRMDGKIVTLLLLLNNSDKDKLINIINILDDNDINYEKFVDYVIDVEQCPIIPTVDLHHNIKSYVNDYLKNKENTNEN